jgi:hypothetical protein
VKVVRARRRRRFEESIFGKLVSRLEEMILAKEIILVRLCDAAGTKACS